MLLGSLRIDVDCRSNDHIGTRVGSSGHNAGFSSEALRAHGKHETAASLITKTIEQNWNSEMIRQYGLLQFKDPSKALIKAEKWVERHTDDAHLYLTLGRLCKHAQLWGKAKAYLESSLSRKPLAETYAELAALHNQLNEKVEAHRCTQKGLMLATKVV